MRNRNNVSHPNHLRFNEIEDRVGRPSILGPGFSAPPGGMEYLDRDEKNDDI
jgi:hypothetical protein